MALLFFPISQFHGFGQRDGNLVATFRTNISFAAGAGKTVAARFGKQAFIPQFSTGGAGDDD
jgi:hypothetical protein